MLRLPHTFSICIASNLCFWRTHSSSIAEISGIARLGDESAVRSEGISRQQKWHDESLKTDTRSKNDQCISFSHVACLPYGSRRANTGTRAKVGKVLIECCREAMPPLLKSGGNRIVTFKNRSSCGNDDLKVVEMKQ